MTSRLSIVIVAVLCLAACGTPGAPRPPSLRLPETVRDLAATRQGSTVTLAWTEPARTTDGENIRALGATLVCMGVNDFPMTHCNSVLADLSSKEFAQCAPQMGKAARCAVTVTQEIQQKYPLGQATFAIEVLNTNGRSAGLSNQVRVPTMPTAAAPRDVRAEVTPDGVVLTGYREELPPYPSGFGFVEHVYRRDAQAATAVDLGEALSLQSGKNVYAKFEDKTAQWEHKYFYRMATVSTAAGSQEAVVGDASPEIEVFVHDAFPPAIPTGVQAVASGVGQQAFVDLTWAPNADSDLAGYNVFRHEEGQVAVKINSELVKAPSYRDSSAQRGRKYWYSVSAVDLRGNESGKSAETSEVVQ